MKLAWYIVHRTPTMKTCPAAFITRDVTSVRYTDPFNKQNDENKICREKKPRP